MATQYLVERADLERDRDAIIELWDRNEVNAPDPAAHFDWAYLENPAGPGCLWLLMHESDRRIIGSVGLIPRRMKIAGAVSVVGRAGGLAIDKQHRSLGPALQLQKTMLVECGAAGVSHVYTVAPPQASPVFKRLKFGCLGQMQTRRKLIRSASTVHGRLSFLPGFVCTPLAAILDLVSLNVAGGPGSRTGGEALTRLEVFDARFDDLWRRAEPHNALATERSAAFLRWRFSAHPRCDDFFCDALQAGDGSLRGYVVYRIHEQTAYIIDLFAAAPGNTETALIAALVRRLRSEGVASLTLRSFGSARFFKSLKRMGFWFHDPSPVEHTLHLAGSGSGGSPAVADDTAWRFLQADDFMNGPW